MSAFVYDASGKKKIFHLEYGMVNPSGDGLISRVQQRNMKARLHLIPPIITSVQTVWLLSTRALGTESTAVYGPY